MKKYRFSHGFTLIELMVTIAIAAILLSIAVPSFQSLIRSSELRGARSIVESAVAFARSEAVARREQISLCPANKAGDTYTCVASKTWNSATATLISFIDENEDGALTSAGDCDGKATVQCVLKDHGKFNSQSTLTSDQNYLAFDRDGALATGGATALRVCSGDAEATNDTRRSITLSLSASGGVRSKKGTTTCP